MERTKFIYWAKCAVVMTAIPLAIYAYATGPDPGHTGAPGEQTCAQSGCHVGTAVNSSSGAVQLAYSGGSSYAPGERGKFTVTITDTTGRQVFGFQASARLSGTTKQAGTLIAGAGQMVQCADGRNLPCRDTAPLQYINHNTPSRTNTITFEWTAPVAGSGSVIVYVAGNAANGNGTESGDRIYTTSLTLTEATTTSSGPKPSVSNGGVVNTWSNSTNVATNTWVSIYGQNLSTTTRDWSGSTEFSQGKLPMSLDGVSVTIGGKSAPVYFVSPGQVNALVPDDTATGNLPLVVTNRNGDSQSATVVRQAVSPALLTVTGSDGKLRVVGRLNSNPNLVLGLATGNGTRPFSPGDVVQFYATGMGATNPSVAVSDVVSGAPALVNTPTIRINNVPVPILGSALVGSGLYQINGTIPDVPNGDQPVVIETNGVSSPTGIVLTIQKQ